MAKIWEEYLSYRLFGIYVRLTTRTCFLSIKSEGLENIPKDGAVLLAPNHCATLMDPLLILMATRPRLVAFGARSDIFRKPKVAKILHWLRIVPIARERNGLSEVAKNFEVFDDIIECMDHDVPFCLFAEGTHRAERGMMPVKKGIFRLAKMAVDQLEKPVYVVPVGLDYEDFFRGYGRTAVRFGEPILMNEAFARKDISEARLYQDLCEELRNRDLALIGRIPERCHKLLPLRILLALITLPLFAVCAVGGLPIWLTHLLMMRKMKDKAWSHTVRFALHFVFPLFWIFQFGFGVLLNFYRNIIEDLRPRSAQQ